MRTNHLLAAAALCILMQGLAHAESTRVATPRGAQIDITTNFPTGPGPFPTVVLASGQGYHMGLPAIERTALRLVELGVAVYRFNWAYFTGDRKTGAPSPDLSAELEDLQTVLKLARANPLVDGAKMSVGGKSLGSLVAWRAFALDKSLRSGLFLTPVCSSADAPPTNTMADDNYPAVASESRPLAFIAGDQDPLCKPAALYRFATNAGGKARIAVVGGDHGFENRSLVGSARTAAHGRSLDSVAQIAASFIVDSLTE